MVTTDTRNTIDSFLQRKFHANPWEEEDIQFYSRDVHGNVYHVNSLEKADSVVFHYKD